MSKFLFVEKINGTTNTGIVDVENQELICYCSKEQSQLILQAFQDSKKYSELGDKVAAFYDEENGEESEGDLGDIGELVATHFGFL